MLTPEQIPPEVVEAAAKEIAMTCRCEMACDWRDHIKDARAAIIATINAWPGGRVKAVLLADTVLLPLPPQEPAR